MRDNREAYKQFDNEVRKLSDKELKKLVKDLIKERKQLEKELEEEKTESSSESMILEIEYEIEYNYGKLRIVNSHLERRAEQLKKGLMELGKHAAITLGVIASILVIISQTINK